MLLACVTGPVVDCSDVSDRKLNVTDRLSIGMGFPVGMEIPRGSSGNGNKAPFGNGNVKEWQ